MTWLSNLWQRLLAWLDFARSKPFEDSDFLRTDSFGPATPEDARVPGSDTQKLYSTPFSNPSRWDALNERAQARRKS